eukprot:7170170-Pyramimonas_sp.AAC.1
MKPYCLDNPRQCTPVAKRVISYAPERVSNMLQSTSSCHESTAETLNSTRLLTGRKALKAKGS